MKLKRGNMSVAYKKSNLLRILAKDFKTYKYVYLMLFPVLLYYLVFCYRPMYGALIAFKDFVPRKGVWGSEWVGLDNFIEFFNSRYFFTVLKNTLTISLISIVAGFPAPIILALLMNEVKNKAFRRSIQTITYLPHFISLVIICGMVKEFTMDTGVVNDIIAFFGGERSTLLSRPEMFVPVYVTADIWQNVGWSSIIYFAALSGIDQELYEAAVIDGAGRWKQTLHVTLPCLLPTIIIMLILRIGNILNIGFEKIILLYNPATYDTADVISTFVYRKGIQESDWSFSTAVGLFNSVVNFTFLIMANQLSKKVNCSGLW